MTSLIKIECSVSDRLPGKPIELKYGNVNEFNRI